MVFPLFTSVCTRRDAKSQRRISFLPYIRDVKGAKIACRRIRVSSGWMAVPSVSVEIYVSEIISFRFSGIKRFISAVFSCDERRETKFDNIFLFFWEGCKFQSYQSSGMRRIIAYPGY